MKRRKRKLSRQAIDALKKKPTPKQAQDAIMFWKEIMKESNNKEESHE